MPFKHGGHLTKDLYGSLASVVAGRVRWLLLDRYLTDRVAGTINGTDAEPGPGTRTLTDSGGAATITGGEYKVAAIAGARDPWLRYTTGWARAAGTALRIDASASGLAADNWLVGFANTLTTPGIAQTLGVVFGATTLKAQPANMQVDAYTAGTDTNIFVILRSTGFYLMINGNLYHIYRSGTTATLYPHIAGLVADASVDCRVDDLGIVELPLTNPSLYPTPKLSDTFDTPVIIDYGDLGLNAIPVNVTLDGTAGKYNGASSYANLFSAGFLSLFDGNEGTFIARAKNSATASRYIFETVVDSNNTVLMYWNGTQLLFSHKGAGTLSTDTIAAVADGAFHTAGCTWSKSGDKATAYYDGSSSGSPATGLGSYTGTPVSARIGANSSTAYVFQDQIKDVIISDVVASDAQMSTIHTALAAGTLTKATLDGIFGASHYVWYKQNETYQSNGLAHVETATITAVDSSVNALNGTHVNVKVEGGVGTYNDTNSYTNIYSAGLASWFNKDNGTIMMRAKPRANMWVDGGNHNFLYLSVNAANGISIVKTTGNNAFRCYYTAGGTVKNSIATITPSSNAFETFGGTWDTTADEVKGYFNGAVAGTTGTSLGVWAGSLTEAKIGIDAFSGALLPGPISDALVAKTTATPAQMATLDAALAAGTLTSTILDTIFGAGNWLWYKYDEAVTYSGEDLTWGQAGLAWNNAQKTYIQPTPGAELLTNGDFTAWTGDDPDGWTVSGESLPDADLNEVGTGETHGGAGTGSANFYHAAAAANFVPKASQTVFTLNEFNRGTAVISAISGAGADFFLGNASMPINATASATRRAIYDYFAINSRSVAGVTAEVTFDSVSATHLTFSDCLRYIDPSVGELLISAKLTITANTQAGFVINLDSGSNPQACIHIWCDRVDNKIYARPMASGAWGADSLAGVAFTYSAGTYLEVRRIGTSVYVWYNGAYIGSWTTTVPATNTKIALFATDSASYFTDITVYPTTGYNYGAYA